MAGLPAALASYLEQRLGDVWVQTTSSGQETLTALGQHACSLLLLDHQLTAPNALDVLQQARTGLGLVHLPVLYCLDNNADGTLPGTLVEHFGVAQLLFYPLDREELARQVATLLSLPMSPVVKKADQRRQQTMTAVAALWERFQESTMQRIAVLEQAVLALLTGALPATLQQQAEREAHKLAGSLGTFGFAKGSQLAQGMEHMLQPGQPLGPPQTLRLSELVVALRQELEQQPGETPSAIEAPGLSETHPRLLIVDDDAELAERLVLEATSHGMLARSARDPATAREAIAHTRPDLVLLDLSFSDVSEDGLALLVELTEATLPVPVLVLTSRHTFLDRVEVARLGGRGFLQKPLSPAHILDAVTQLWQQLQPTPARVLAVDDDPQILATLEALLGSQHLEVTTLDDPLRFWQSLTEVSPDLLMLDVDMPHVNGIDLCRVVRNEPRWRELPVLFLTAHTDADTIHRIFAARADDYVSKPIVGPELVARIRNRLERVQLLRRMAETDPLTGLANRRKSSQVLEQFLRLAQRNNHPLSLAILHLDHLKKVNDDYGHEAGDAVLRRLAALLQRAFRSEDVVARWGGEEFVVGMYAMPRDDGVHRLAEVLETLRQEEFSGLKDSHLRVTFSAGVAAYPTDGADVQALYRAADQTLSQAKVSGRNRVLPVGWDSAPAQTVQHVDVVVVDDDETLTGLLLHALETRGYRACRLSNGQQALKHLGGASPSLTARVVLLDVNMPGLDGLSLLRHLAHDGVLQHTQVIMLTFRSREDEVLQALELGACDHVSKPFSLPVLMQRIRRALHV
jgi:diguanylate cyclase (GGDEF)-like protein